MYFSYSCIPRCEIASAYVQADEASLFFFFEKGGCWLQIQVTETLEHPLSEHSKYRYA